jgi:hypothetical protein
MYTKTGRKKEDEEENRQIKTSKTRQQQVLPTDTHSVFNLSGKNFFCFSI